jgi:hypothetical protein
MKTQNLELESIVKSDVKVTDKNMTFCSVFKAMIPSIIIGTAAAAGCQEIASKYTQNPEAISVAGMVGQYVGGSSAYIRMHYQNNKDRLRDENGKIKWGQFAQDIGAILASDRIGDKLLLASYGLSNGISLRKGLDPSTAGIISGAISGLVYSTFTAYAAPKVNSAINYVKGKLRRKENATLRI